MTEEVRRVADGSDEAAGEDAWERLTDEPYIRGVNSLRWDEDQGYWQVVIWAQEFFRGDPLGTELRERVVSALESVGGVTRVTEHDNESWDAWGAPSGEALTSAAANVVDDLAGRLREAMGLPESLGWPCSMRRLRLHVEAGMALEIAAPTGDSGGSPGARERRGIDSAWRRVPSH